MAPLLWARSLSSRCLRNRRDGAESAPSTRTSWSRTGRSYGPRRGWRSRTASRSRGRSSAGTDVTPVEPYFSDSAPTGRSLPYQVPRGQRRSPRSYGPRRDRASLGSLGRSAVRAPPAPRGPTLPPSNHTFPTPHRLGGRSHTRFDGASADPRGVTGPDATARLSVISGGVPVGGLQLRGDRTPPRQTTLFRLRLVGAESEKCTSTGVTSIPAELWPGEGDGVGADRHFSDRLWTRGSSRCGSSSF